MSNFPYNSHKPNSNAKTTNGCPLTYREAWSLADKLRFWHGEIAHTSNWTQSSDGAQEDTENIAYGLMELFSDPGAIGRLEMTGRAVRQIVNYLTESRFESEFFNNALKIAESLFDDDDDDLEPTRQVDE